MRGSAGSRLRRPRPTGWPGRSGAGRNPREPGPEAVATLWWGPAAVFAAAAGWEWFWRRRGFAPRVRDDWPAWALKRGCAGLKGPGAVALVGSSRMQVGLCPRMLAGLTGRRPVMLAVDGSSPLAVLADLSGDRAFTGTVLCSLTPAFLAEPQNPADRAAKWVRKYRHISPPLLSLWRLRLFLQGRLVCLSPDLAPSRLLIAARTAAWPQPHRAPMAPDRSRAFKTVRVDVDALRRGRERRQEAACAAARPLTPERFGERVKRIAAQVDVIRRRGGEVVFLRLPSSGRVRELEERTWPRERYWDRLAAGCGALAIHFEDHPRLAGFRCPDGSHLGAGDARRFSRALLGLLRDGLEEKAVRAGDPGDGRAPLPRGRNSRRSGS